MTENQLFCEKVTSQFKNKCLKKHYLERSKELWKTIRPILIGKKMSSDSCDDDQCVSGNNRCHVYATCINKCSGYECKCSDGYQGDGFNCSPNSEISRLTNMCTTPTVTTLSFSLSPHFWTSPGMTTNPIFTNYLYLFELYEYYNCLRDASRSESGYNAKEKCKHKIKSINEPCAYHTCDVNADCIPTGVKFYENDYECKCHEGYVGDGFYCEAFIFPFIFPYNEN